MTVEPAPPRPHVRAPGLIDQNGLRCEVLPTYELGDETSTPHTIVRRHPEQIDGSFYIRQDWDDKGWSVMYEDETLAEGFAVGPPTEFVLRTDVSQIRFALPR